MKLVFCFPLSSEYILVSRSGVTYLVFCACRSQRGEPARRGVRQRAAAAGLDPAAHRGAGAQRRAALRHQPHPPGERGPRPAGGGSPPAPLTPAPRGAFPSVRGSQLPQSRERIPRLITPNTSFLPDSNPRKACLIHSFFPTHTPGRHTHWDLSSHILLRAVRSATLNLLGQSVTIPTCILSSRFFQVQVNPRKKHPCHIE